jgi:hypothetical protein
VVIGYSNSLTGKLANLLAHSGSVVLMPDTPYRYHFSARLVPWVHYIPLSYSSADLIEKLEWLRAHDDVARQIAKNAANFGRSYLRIEDYVCYALAALQTIGELEMGSDVLSEFPPDIVNSDDTHHSRLNVGLSNINLILLVFVALAALVCIKFAGTIPRT